MMRSGLRRRADARGAAAVEFALVLLPLMLIVFGIISYGYMLSFRQAISQAAAEGARAAAVAQKASERESDARAALNQALGSYGVSCTGSNLLRDTVTVGTCAVSAPAACAGDPNNDCITVTVNYDYDEHPLLPAPGLGVVLPDQLEYSAVARVS
jgi:Flp pilus assembly protein TadG